MGSDDLLRSLVDRAEIQDLVVKYFVAADDDDLDAIGALFAPDGKFELGGGAEPVSGRENVKAFVKDFRAPMGPTIHTPDYTLVQSVNGDRATALSGAHLELARGGTTLWGAVRYEDELVRIDGTWLFASRAMKTIHIGPWDDAGTSLTTPLRARWPGGPASEADLPKPRQW